MGWGLACSRLAGLEQEPSADLLDNTKKSVKKIHDVKMFYLVFNYAILYNIIIIITIIYLICIIRH